MGTSFCSTCATSTPGEFAGAPVGVAFEQPVARSKAVAVRQSVARTTNLCFKRVVTFISDNCEAAREWRLEATAHSTLSTTVKVRGAAEGEKLPRQRNSVRRALAECSWTRKMPLPRPMAAWANLAPAWKGMT